MHRLVMEHMLARPLLPDEDVHHLDGDRQNNQPENLQLLTHGEHASRSGLASPRVQNCVTCGRPFMPARPTRSAKHRACSLPCKMKWANRWSHAKRWQRPPPVPHAPCKLETLLSLT
ncbi:MAG: HNH endonuclease signature motif containing protein [Verrucomicrobia bacterium]|nr:HNH endonuclease signature motif containing protein [Verrucomicrobiota bacterium]